jgi:cytidylate kinase
MEVRDQKLAIVLQRHWGYRCLDKNIVTKLAQKTYVTETEVSAFEERGASTLGHFFQKFFYPHHLPPTSIDMIDDMYWTTPNTSLNKYNAFPFDEELCAKHTRDLILQEADQGNVVIVGRGAVVLLADHPNTLHVSIFAPQTYRLDTLIKRYGLSTQEAGRRLQTVDLYRAHFVKRHYQANQEDPSYHHLLINSGKIDIESATQIILETAENKQVHKTWLQTIGLLS